TLAQHHAMLAEQATTIAELQRDKEGLEHRLSLALRRLYGRTSEKIDAAQLLLFGQSMQEQAQRVEALADAQQQADDGPSRKRRGHGRKPLPADLPRHRIEHPIDPAELTCPCCRGQRDFIGNDLSEQLD